MGDYESRMEDARVEALIERALRNGTMGECRVCRDATSNKDEDDRWFCRYCERDEESKTAPATDLQDAWRMFSEQHGSESPLRTEEELREAIHVNGLLWGKDKEAWWKFWDTLFNTEDGQEWLYSETPPNFTPVAI